MLGEEKTNRLLESIIAYSKADQTEVSLIASTSSLTRFANNGIHQNVSERDIRLTVRTVFGKRVGVASTNQLSLRAQKDVVEKALEITKFQEENPDFVSLPGPTPTAISDGFVLRTAGCTPKYRADAVSTICKKAKGFELVASGAFETSITEVAIANTLGIKTYNAGTSANISTVIMSEDSSGYADFCSKDVNDINAEAVGNEAISKALRGHDPAPLGPGDYEVVLEEYAVADIVETLAYLGLGALSVQENRSFMNDRFGSKIVSDRVNIWDDGLNPSGLPMPFDFEGVAKKRVNLVVDGIAENVVYDSYTALREGKQSTGHALPAPNTYGPMPLNLFMKPGTSSLADMVQSVKRGILVTRFHYTSPVHPTKVIVTGMTRDGTFLIENGEVTRPLLNMRFTESYLDALSRVVDVGARTRLETGYLGGVCVPALRIGSFRFTGVTEY